MSISQFLNEATTWLAWFGLGLGILALIAFLFKWGIRFRLIGATIFTLLLSGSCWAFIESYRPPITIQGALYVPVVYDNGADLVVAQAPEDFPNDAIQPSLEQIAENLKGGGRNVENVFVRIRRIEQVTEGISKPVVLGEIIRDPSKRLTIPVSLNKIKEMNEFDQKDTSQALEGNKANDPESSEEMFDIESSENIQIDSFSDEETDLI